MGKAVAEIVFWMVVLGTMAGAQECPIDEKSTADESIGFLKRARSIPNPNSFCVQAAIDALDGNGVRTKEAIDVFIDYLEFERPGCEKLMEVSVGCLTSARYSAALALRDIGKPALPALVRVVSGESASGLARANAIDTTVEIINGPSGAGTEGVRFFRNEAARATDGDAAGRLREAASDAVAYCYGEKSKKRCEDVLNAPECPGGDASTGELIAFMKDAHVHPGIDPECIQIGIGRLGRARTNASIEALTEYLEFERTGCNDDERVFRMSCHLIGKHPAALELWHIGKPALPTLVKMVSEDGLPTGARSVAVETIMEIFRDDGKVEGIRFLLDEAAHSTDSARADWLRRAASDALPYCYGQKAQQQCRDALNSQTK